MSERPILELVERLRETARNARTCTGVTPVGMVELAKEADEAADALIRLEAERDEARQSAENWREAQRVGFAKNAKLRAALERIAAPHDCGCSPPCQCNSVEALAIEIDGLKDIAALCSKGTIGARPQ